MHFSYRGFKQNNGNRGFTFYGVETKQPDRVFYLTVDLTLLAEHHVSLQETPGLCVELLTRAATEGENRLTGCNNYALCGSDLLAFTAPRRAQALARSSKRVSTFHRAKPSEASQPFAPPREQFPA